MLHDEWERQNQEQLKQWYDEDYLVYKINCAGCGREFYTTVRTKKYCNNYICATKVNNALQKVHRRERRTDLVCACCGKLFTPQRSDAKFCSNACRQKAYRQNVTVAKCPQNKGI